MVIRSKADRLVKHAGNDGQAELQRERRVTGTEGTCLQKLRDTIALLASECNFKEPPA